MDSLRPQGPVLRGPEEPHDGPSREEEAVSVRDMRVGQTIWLGLGLALKKAMVRTMQGKH